MYIDKPLQRGFTLFDVLTSLAIIVIVYGIAIPSFTSVYQSHQTTSATNKLTGALHFTRQHAASKYITTTLCPKALLDQCGKEWENGIIIFEDANKNGKREASETLIKVIESWPEGSDLRWSSFGSSYYLRYTTEGATLNQNGSFIYCPPDRDATNGNAIVINKSGRPRLATDSDGDGIKETTTGNNISC